MRFRRRDGGRAPPLRGVFQHRQYLAHCRRRHRRALAAAPIASTRSPDVGEQGPRARPEHQALLPEPLISKVTASFFTIFLRDSNTHTCMILTQLTYLVLVGCLISKHRSNCDNRNWCCGLFHNPSLIVNRRRTEDQKSGNHFMYISFSFSD